VSGASSANASGRHWAAVHRLPLENYGSGESISFGQGLSGICQNESLIKDSFSRDHGMEMRPDFGILAHVRDSTIAPPKGPWAPEQGIRRPWFFYVHERRGHGGKKDILKFPLALLKNLGHLFITACE